jgi:hypothetical protein
LVYDEGLRKFPKDFDLAYNKLVCPSKLLLGDMEPKVMKSSLAVPYPDGSTIKRAGGR